MTCDPHLRLTRLLREHAGPDARLIETRAEPWASITFGGMRHRLLFALPDGADGRLTRVPLDALTIPGHLLADFSLIEHGARDGVRMVECAALTVEAA